MRHRMPWKVVTDQYKKQKNPRFCAGLENVGLLLPIDVLLAS